MIFAFAGSHRTGKTTLALRTGEVFGLPVILTQTSGLTKELGIDLKGELTFAARLAYQEAVLERLMMTYDEAMRRHKSFITDRTPLDAAAYLLADCSNIAGTLAERQAVLDYVKRCQLYTKALFESVILVPPALPLTDDANKGAASEAYQLHHHLLIRGLLAEDCDEHVDWQEIKEHMVDLDWRMEFVKWVLGRFGIMPSAAALAA